MAKPATFDRLVDAVTELVVAEMTRLRAGGSGEVEGPPTSIAPLRKPEAPGVAVKRGPKLLVIPGSSRLEAGWWEALSGAEAAAAFVYLWSGFGKDQLPGAAAGLGLEGRNQDLAGVAGDYAAICLLGPTLPQLGALGSLGAGGSPPAALVIEAIALGRPVFIDREPIERLVRHSSRLPAGFVRRVEEVWRTVQSFGVTPIASQELRRHLSSLTGAATGAPPTAGRGGGRDVVTAEDVEAVRQGGGTEVAVAHGTIVTALARQKALEWGMEIRFR